MEVEFNPSRVSSQGYSDPTTERIAASKTSKASDSVNAPDAADLHSQPANLPLVRADKVAHARALVAETHYPPNDLLDRIAILLAARIKSR